MTMNIIDVYMEKKKKIIYNSFKQSIAFFADFAHVHLIDSSRAFFAFSLTSSLGL